MLASSPIDLLTDQALETAANELGWTWTFVDTNYVAATANADIEADVSAGDNLIADVSWNLASISAGVAAATAAKIPVVELVPGEPMSSVGPGKFAAMYNENETTMGSILAKYIVKHVKNANIADLWTNANYAGGLRNNALKSVVAHTKGAKIGYSVLANLTAPQANIQAAFAADPKVNAVYLIFDDMDVAAAAEIRTLHKTKVKIYGYFTEAANLALMKSGQIAALATDNMPKAGIVTVDQFLNVTTKSASWDQNAMAQAGGLQYTVVTKPVAPYKLATTMAPFIKKWKAAGYCTYGVGTVTQQ
jgi:ABC-type sugar transport system substrate-binding protein